MSLVEVPVRGKNGGARPGAGRKGVQVRELYKAATKICREVCITPIEILVGRMAYWHFAAEDALVSMQKCRDWLNAQLTSTPKLEEDRKRRDEIFELMKRYDFHISKFENSEVKEIDYADRAAPYCHPRLAAVAVKQEVDVNLQTINRGDDLLQSQQRYVEYLRLNPPPIPEIEDEE